MTQNALRTRLGLFVVVAHLATMILVIGLFALHGLLFEEMTTALGIIAPMFAGHATVTIRWILINSALQKDSSSRLNPAAVFVSLAIPTTFVVVLWSITLAKAFQVGFGSFEQYKITLGLIEAVFGVYFAQVVALWFKELG